MALLQIFLLNLISLGSTEPKPGKKDTDYMAYRTRAFEAYAEQKWDATRKLLQASIDNYAFRKRALSYCIQTCSSDENYDVDLNKLLAVPSMAEYLATMGCVERCCREKMGEPLVIEDGIIEEIYRKNQYYSIIQQTYQMTGDAKGQIEAGEAFYLFNPSNVAMYNRLKKLYQDNGMSEALKPSNFPLYHEQYTEGVAAYVAEDWPKCSYFIEQSIATYLKFTDMCRVRCTYPYDKPAALSKVLELTGAMREVSREVAECRQSCYADLPLRSLTKSPYLAGMLEYIQYCQYMMGQYQQSANTCYTYTLLDSRNDMINDNLDVYREVNEIEIQARQDIKTFLENYKSDLQLLKQGGKFEDLPKGFISERNYYAAANIVSPPECNALVNLIKEYGKENDGYEAYQNKGSSPFTDSEKFFGLELDAIIELLEDGQVEVPVAQLFLDAVNAAKDHIERNFKLTRPLYFDYVHLVLRSAIPGVEREEFSHPIHGDNCVLRMSDKSCTKEEPAYTHRDWSGLLYLLPPKEGGEFVIVDNDFSELASVTPNCGTVVGFTGGTYHGVKSIQKGKRVAIGLWFTHSIANAMDMESYQRRIESVAIQDEQPQYKDEL